MTLYLKEALALWRSMHFMGHFMIAAILLIGFVFPPRPPRKAAAQAAPAQASVQTLFSAALRTLAYMVQLCKVAGLLIWV